MTRREQLKKIYNHENIGYVPCFFTDFDMTALPFTNERPLKNGVDSFGVEWTFVPQVNAPMVKSGSKVINDITRWKETIVIPDADAFNWNGEAEKDTANWDRDNKLSQVLISNGLFERVHSLMGFEDALCNMYEEPEAMHELIEAITEYRLKCIEYIGKYYKPDEICFQDDYGSENKLFMSPEMWRDFYKEPLKRIIDRTHEMGMLYEHHSCGYIEPIFDEFVEMGIDAINPLQISNPIRELKNKYQDRIVFCGGFDNQGVFDRSGVTDEEIKAEVKRTVNLLAPGGSYVIFPLAINFSILPAVISTHIELANSYGELNMEPLVYPMPPVFPKL